MECDIERLTAYKLLLERAEWAPSPPRITAHVSFDDMERRKAELQVTYLQYRMQQERGDLC